MNEKRTTHRLDIELPATIEMQGVQKAAALATTLNISGTGVCLQSKQRFNVGQDLVIKLKIPEEGQVSIHVKVVWVKEAMNFNTREYIAGIRITDAMKLDEAKFIKFYADQLIGFFKGKNN